MNSSVGAVQKLVSAPAAVRALDLRQGVWPAGAESQPEVLHRV